MKNKNIRNLGAAALPLSGLAALPTPLANALDATEFIPQDTVSRLDTIREQAPFQAPTLGRPTPFQNILGVREALRPEDFETIAAGYAPAEQQVAPQQQDQAPKLSEQSENVISSVLSDSEGRHAATLGDIDPISTENVRDALVGGNISSLVSDFGFDMNAILPAGVSSATIGGLLSKLSKDNNTAGTEQWGSPDDSASADVSPASFTSVVDGQNVEFEVPTLTTLLASPLLFVSALVDTLESPEFTAWVNNQESAFAPAATPTEGVAHLIDSFTRRPVTTILQLINAPGAQTWLTNPLGAVNVVTTSIAGPSFSADVSTVINGLIIPALGDIPLVIALTSLLVPAGTILGAIAGSIPAALLGGLIGASIGALNPLNILGGLIGIIPGAIIGALIFGALGLLASSLLVFPLLLLLPLSGAAIAAAIPVVIIFLAVFGIYALIMIIPIVILVVVAGIIGFFFAALIMILAFFNPFFIVGGILAGFFAAVVIIIAGIGLLFLFTIWIPVIIFAILAIPAVIIAAIIGAIIGLIIAVILVALGILFIIIPVTIISAIPGAITGAFFGYLAGKVIATLISMAVIGLIGAVIGGLLGALGGAILGTLAGLIAWTLATVALLAIIWFLRVQNLDAETQGAIDSITGTLIDGFNQSLLGQIVARWNATPFGRLASSLQALWNSLSGMVQDAFGDALDAGVMGSEPNIIISALIGALLGGLAGIIPGAIIGALIGFFNPLSLLAMIPGGIIGGVLGLLAGLALGNILAIIGGLIAGILTGIVLYIPNLVILGFIWSLGFIPIILIGLAIAIILPLVLALIAGAVITGIVYAIFLGIPLTIIALILLLISAIAVNPIVMILTLGLSIPIAIIAGALALILAVTNWGLLIIVLILGTIIIGAILFIPLFLVFSLIGLSLIALYTLGGLLLLPMALGLSIIEGMIVGWIVKFLLDIITLPLGAILGTIIGALLGAALATLAAALLSALAGAGLGALVGGGLGALVGGGLGALAGLNWIGILLSLIGSLLRLFSAVAGGSAALGGTRALAPATAPTRTESFSIDAIAPELLADYGMPSEDPLTVQQSFAAVPEEYILAR